jgi:N-acetylneuraminic acid mutarotase
MIWRRPTCLLLSTGKTLVFESGRAALFDASSREWTVIDHFTTTQDPSAVELPDGTVYAAGFPTNATSSPGSAFRGVYRLDATTLQWTGSSPWPYSTGAPSWSSRLVYFRGDVLVISGTTNNARPMSEITAYSPSTDTWTAREPYPYASSSGVSRVARYQDRLLLVVNGSPYFYDLDTEAWERLPMIPWGGSSQVPFHLGNGEFIVIGTYSSRFRITP